MTTFYLVRHGETDLNRQHELNGGLSNSQLTKNGRKVAIQLGVAMRNIHFDRVVTSSMARAIQTTTLLMLSNRFPVTPVEYSDELREMVMGDWDGLPIEQINAEGWRCFRYYPQCFDAEWAGQIGAETYQQVSQRITTKLQNLAAAYPEGRLLIVAHGLVFLVLVNSLLGGSIKTIHQVPMMKNATISRIDKTADGAFHVIAFNLNAKELTRTLRREE